MTSIWVVSQKQTLLSQEGDKRRFLFQPPAPRQGTGSICRLNLFELEESQMKLHSMKKVISLAAAAALTLSLAACSGGTPRRQRQ